MSDATTGIGGGKYDAETTAARIACQAEGVVLMVFRGKHGEGFSVQAPADIVVSMPQILRQIADNIERLQKTHINQ